MIFVLRYAPLEIEDKEDYPQNNTTGIMILILVNE